MHCAGNSFLALLIAAPGVLQKFVLHVSHRPILFFKPKPLTTLIKKRPHQGQKGHEGFSEALLDVIGRLDGEREEEDDAVVGLVDDRGERVSGQAVEVGREEPHLKCFVSS